VLLSIPLFPLGMIASTAGVCCLAAAYLQHEKEMARTSETQVTP
jgi:hypothetical protein